MDKEKAKPDTINCRLVFHDFIGNYVDQFFSRLQKHSFQHIRDLKVSDQVAINPESSNTITEAKISFRLSLPDVVGRTQKYDSICYAICEVSKEIHRVRGILLNAGNKPNSIVIMTILDKNIYPHYFGLQSVFATKKLSFGSIINKQNFATIFNWNEPRNENNENEVFNAYLEEQRDISSETKGINMFTIFDHDRDTFTVSFPDVKIVKKEERSGKRVVDIQVPYSSIRRIVASLDFDKADKNNQNVLKCTFTFQLNHPPSVQVYEMQGSNYRAPRGQPSTKFRTPNRFLTWNQGIDVQNAMKYGSCLVVECVFISPRQLLDCLDRLRKSLSYPIEFRHFTILPNKNIKRYPSGPDDILKKYKMLDQEDYFPLAYAIQALISRGGEIYDWFFREEYNHFEKFVSRVIEQYEMDKKNYPLARITKTVLALESLLQEMDRSHDVPDPLESFVKLYSDSSNLSLSAITEELNRDGYMRVRKVIVTPTRVIFLNPELLMGNRSLRRKGAENMLRVVFRDDDNRKVSKLPPKLIDDTVRETLAKPLSVGFRDFHYLCSSNSQLRDHGCYFLAGTADEVANFRFECGRFKIESVSKMMSRMGQCFTQAKKSGVEIERSQYSDLFDFIGGQDGNGKPYTFSDGCGMISGSFAQKIVMDMRLGDCKPSCFQIRFRGYKGIVAVNRLLDDTNHWAEKYDIDKRNDIPFDDRPADVPWYKHSLIFRPSQKKFHAPREKNVEIVKISAPILVSLNKPLINILDQVSGMQGDECHRRMCSRINELMEQHIESITMSLIDEPLAFMTLNEFPKYIPYGLLKDFNITEEPFFRSMLRSSALVGLHKLVDKMQIKIPASQGRMMFGVVDETGILQYGQVFVQYTTNATLKYPSPNSDKNILTGPVMVTKNPSIVAGDVRMFEAVDLSCLHHLVDVIVFPQSGPRPHPDEMAGSDLDGDEYSIFWDPRIFIDYNEPAFDFTAKVANQRPAGTDQEIRENFTEHMINFFTQYIKSDSVGTMANAHLANSDLYGINSEHCKNIAKKHNQAVDFSKNGVLPDELTSKWGGDFHPPEKVERFPNFMARTTAASYKSTRLLGDLYSRAMEVREMIRVEEVSSFDDLIKVDQSLLWGDDRKYEKTALAAFDEYRTLISGICESYGIVNEGQLFSGRFTALKKRISDKDDDNMSLFNAQHMIEEQVSQIYARFRIKFFEEFGGFESCTQLDETRNYNGIREVFRRVVSYPLKVEWQRKASAYYRVAYEHGKYLSFAWVVADILAQNRQAYLTSAEHFKSSLCPLTNKLSEIINDFCESEGENFKNFQSYIKKSIKQEKSSKKISLTVAQYCQSFQGLDKLIYFVRKWKERHDIDEERIRSKIMDNVVIAYGLGNLKRAEAPWLTRPINGTVINLEEQLGGLGKRFWALIRFFATRNFGFSDKVNLTISSAEDEKKDRFLKLPDCLALFFAAEDTFFPIAVNRRFDSLPGTTEDRKVNSRVTEGFIFVVEIPREAENHKVLFEELAKKCGCQYAVTRRKPDRMNAKSNRVAIKPVGNFIAVRKFRTLLEVQPNMDEPNLRLRSEGIAKEVYDRLVFYNKPEISVDEKFKSLKNAAPFRMNDE